MVGGCGVIGRGDRPIEDMAATLAWTGEERSFEYEDASLRLIGFDHRPDRAMPGRTPGGDALVWVWGNVFGFDAGDGYRSRDPRGGESAAEYCARLYDEHGADFVAGLNGDFVGIVHDRRRSTVTVFTDRLGTWRLFYARSGDGQVVFSSHVQALADYPPVTLAFDEAYVVQHLSDRGGPYGLKTPIEGVELFHPGAVTTFDLTAEPLDYDVDVYWRPRFDPVDGERFVDAFVDRLRASVDERVRDRSKRYGLLISGGSDARLVLAALPDDLDLVAFHMADWMSKEARTAERVAMAKDVEFRFLRRDPDYFGRLLDRTPAMWNFEQLFNQAWAEGFMDEIRSEVDVLLTGHFCDTMFKGLFVPQLYAGVGPIGYRKLPVELPVETTDDLITEYCPTAPAFVNSDVDLRSVLKRNVIPVDGGVESYGVRFPTLRDGVLGLMHYPATTDPFFRQSLRENLVLRMPVLDNRIIDLWLRLPPREAIRRNLVGSAVEAMDPELAAIPHASTGVPVGRSRLLHRLGAVPMNALRRLSPFDSVPVGHVNHHPWGDHAALIRTRPFVEDTIDESADLIETLPFLDRDAVVDCLQAHLAGEDNTRSLYRLVTFLKAPITEQIASSGLERRGDRSRTDGSRA